MKRKEKRRIEKKRKEMKRKELHLQCFFDTCIFIIKHLEIVILIILKSFFTLLFMF